MTSICDQSTCTSNEAFAQLEDRLRQKADQFQNEIESKLAELNGSIYSIQCQVHKFVQQIFSDLRGNIKPEHHYDSASAGLNTIAESDIPSRRESTNSNWAETAAPLFLSIKLEAASTPDTITPLDDKCNIETANTAAAGQVKATFCCSQCQQTLPTSKALTFHMSVVHDIVLPRKKYPQSNKKTDQTFMCDICPAMFHEINMFKAHRRTHTGENWFECDICGKKAALKNTLLMHMRRHSGERPYQCDVCSKTFRFPGSFRCHKQIHEAAVCRPYKCTMCDKSFRQKSHLTVHIQTHTGERPHLCPICNRGYTKRYHVKNHLRKFHEIVDCDAVFPGKKRRSNLVASLPDVS